MDRLLRRRVPRIVAYVKDRRRRMPRNPGVLRAETLPQDKTVSAPGPVAAEDTSRFYDALGVRDFALEGGAAGAPSRPVPDAASDGAASRPPALARPEAGGNTSRTMRMLVAEHRGIDAALDALLLRKTPVQPTTALMNEAVLHLVTLDRHDDARALVAQMGPKYHAQPDSATTEILAYGLVIRGDTNGALKMLQTAKDPFVSKLAPKLYNSIITTLRAAGRTGDARAMFESAVARASVAPPAAVAATIIGMLASEDCVESAFVTYTRLTAAAPPGKRLEPSALCHAALIRAATRRKEYFGRAMQLFQEMQTLGMPVSTNVYNDLLYGCAKTAALSTAMELWRTVVTSQDPNIRPNSYTIANYMWALCSTEMPQHTGRISVHRQYHWEGVSPAELSRAAHEVMDWASANGIEHNAHMLVAFLALHANQCLVLQAEDIFWRRIWGTDASASMPAFGHEMMLKMYDTLRDYAGARRIYEHYRDNFVDAAKGTSRVRLPYEGWRALARVAVLTDHLEEALEYVREMRNLQGFAPHLDDFRVLLMRFSERSRPELCRQLADICNTNADLPKMSAQLASSSRETVADLLQRCAQPANKYVRWIERSRAVGTLLGRAYGRDAPSTVTDPPKQPKA